MRRWFLLWVGLSGGCTELLKVEDTAASDTDVDTDTNTNIPTNECEPDGETDFFESGIFGVATHSMDEAVACFRVQYCSEAGCQPGETNGNGAYTVLTDGVGAMGGLEFIPLTDTYSHLSHASVPFQLNDRTDVELNVHLLELSQTLALPEEKESVHLGDGVWLDASFSDVELALGAQANGFGAVEVPESLRLPITLTETVVAVWYLSPFDTRAVAEPLAVRIEDRWELEPGQSYSLHEFAIEEDAYFWRRVGSYAVVDGFLVGEKGTGLQHLTTIALVVDE